MASDYESRKRALERRRQLTETLLQRGMTAPSAQGQMIGPHYLAPGLGEALMPALSALAGGVMGGRLDKEEASLEAERRKEIAAAMQGIQEKQKAGDSSWMFDPLTMSDPTLQEFAKTAFKEQVKPEEFSYGSGVGPDGKPILLARGKRGTIKPTDYTPVPKISTSYGMGYDTATGKPTGRIATPPDRSTNVSVNTFLPEAEKYLNRKTGTLVGERVVDQLLQRRQSVVKDYETATNLQGIAQQEMATGQLAPIGVFLGQLGSSLGMKPSEALTNAERYDANIERAVADMIMTDPKGITNEDAKRFARAWAPLASSPEGRMKIIQDIKDLRRKEFNRIEGATEQLKERNPGLYEMIQIDPAMQSAIPAEDVAPAAPATPAPQPAQPMPVVPQGPVQIGSDMEYDALPPGTIFIAPDGTTRRKP